MKRGKKDGAGWAISSEMGFKRLGEGKVVV